MTTLFIDPSRSYCGACDGNASPYELAHLNENMHGPGCGAVYTETSSHYEGSPGLVDAIKTMRPDLPYVGWTPDEQATR